MNIGRSGAPAQLMRNPRRHRGPRVQSGERSMKQDTSSQTLQKRGIRLTRQRQLLLDLIEKSGEHLDAETLYKLANARDPKLNRVTVYRTIKMLKEGGLVDELDLMHFGGDQHYYETRKKQEHAHIICLRCGRVEEFYGDPLTRLRRQVEATFGFQILIARTEIGGYCSHCQVLRLQEIESVLQNHKDAEVPPKKDRKSPVKPK
jgi:Fur family ferric uptake transcriptional regulator